MEVKLAGFCDAANISREGKLNILGEFNTLYAAAVPVIWPLMYVVIKIEATAGEGPPRFGLRVPQ